MLEVPPVYGYGRAFIRVDNPSGVRCHGCDLNDGKSEHDSLCNQDVVMAQGRNCTEHAVWVDVEKATAEQRAAYIAWKLSK